MTRCAKNVKRLYLLVGVYELMQADIVRRMTQGKVLSGTSENNDARCYFASWAGAIHLHCRCGRAATGSCPSAKFPGSN